MIRRLSDRSAVLCALLLCVPGIALAQDPAAAPSRWTVMGDGVVFLTFNNQGGLRGETEFVSQNWAMGMASRRLGGGALTFTGMFSLEPLTAPNPGYSEIFQVGETYRGLQITDHQHPHDLIMQLSAAWRVPVGAKAHVTLAGGPRGEAALGPVAFMHRASSSENPTAPLAHHIFDSTHIATNVLLAGVGAGPVAFEASWFKGRESDDERYDLETGWPDSWSVRAWFRPTAEWSVQVSHGFLREPEALEPGDQRRTNVSASWLREKAAGFSAATVAWGRSARQFSTVRALLAEYTQQFDANYAYARFEDLTVETEILLFPEIIHRPHPNELIDPIRTVTAGGVRDLFTIAGLKLGVGGDVTFYSVPDLLQFTHGERPVSFHVFARLKPSIRRMWNMTMGGGMEGRGGAHDHGAMQH